MSSKSDIGIIGLSPDGQSLARNFANHGLRVVIINPFDEGQESLLETFIGDYEGDFVGTRDLSVFVELLDRPRMIQLMIDSGEKTDQMIHQLIPLLDDDDILIDGSDTHYQETESRIEQLKDKNIHYAGMGLSGSQEQILNGPSLMVGGSEKAKELVLKMFRPICSSKDKPGLIWTGPGGSGHFAKMVQRGLEYSEMQLIIEIFALLRGMALSREQISEIFDDWQNSIIGSNLLKATSSIIRKKEGDEFLIDQIIDSAGTSEPGIWLGQTALEYGVPIPTLMAAINTRLISNSAKRLVFKELYNHSISIKSKSKSRDVDGFKSAILAVRLMIYGQGIDLIRIVSRKNGWQINIPELFTTWDTGGMMQSNLLENIIEACSSLETPHFLTNNPVKRLITESLGCLSRTVTLGSTFNIPIPVISNSLQHLNSLSATKLYQNIIQAQRDYFSGQGFELKSGSEKISEKNWSSKN